MKIKGNTVGTPMLRPDWNQTDPKKSDYIYNKPDVQPGEGKASVQGGIDNRAISEGTFTHGKGNFVGLKGYYYSGIDVEAKTITLSTKQNVADAEGIQVTWAVGDKVTIVNDSHYDRCSTITAINGNVITVDSFPFTKVVVPSDPDWDDNTIFVVEKPEAGIVDLGRYSIAIGEGNIVSERASAAIGRGNVVQGKYGVALGRGNNIKAYAGVALGRGNTIENTALYASATGVHNTVTGTAAHAGGNSSKATAAGAYAYGYKCEASGEYSHAEGTNNIASGNYSHVEGHQNTASGCASHAEGNTTKAIGEHTHAEGEFTTARGDYSHAEGGHTEANGVHSHAEGLRTKAEGEKSHAEGMETSALGVASHAEGKTTTAEGAYSHAEGQQTKAIGGASHAEGNLTEATGTISHAEGELTKASGNYAHAEGYKTTASGSAAHSQGRETTASGDYSHASGHLTSASGESSFATGVSTIAEAKGSFVSGKGIKSVRNYSAWFGMYNKPENSHLFGVGVGTSDTDRANAMVVHSSGNLDVCNHRIMKVADAVNNDDAVNLKKLNEVVSAKQNIITHRYTGGPASARYWETNFTPTNNTIVKWLEERLAEMPDGSGVNVSGHFFNEGNSHYSYGTLYKQDSNHASLYTTSYVDDEWRLQKIDGKWQEPEYITRVDFVIAQGTSGDWTYRKWNSGIAECWGLLTVIPIEATTHARQDFYLPFTFSEVPRALATSNAYSQVEVSATVATTVVAIIVDVREGAIFNAGSNIKTAVHVIGRWK